MVNNKGEEQILPRDFQMEIEWYRTLLVSCMLGMLQGVYQRCQIGGDGISTVNSMAIHHPSPQRLAPHAGLRLRVGSGVRVFTSIPTRANLQARKMPKDLAGAPSALARCFLKVVSKVRLWQVISRLCAGLPGTSHVKILVTCAPHSQCPRFAVTPWTSASRSEP